MKRVLRMESAVPSGKIILDFIRSPEARKLLREAAESGRPPIGAISQKLRELIERDVLELMLVKQFCGTRDKGGARARRLCTRPARRAGPC